ncbi:SPX domain family protein [Clavispora lusitaniae]|uniref:SPX domain family protein n=1 Tax=Clavispora lusitaniae TaxID=36911 RepID=UPI00202C11C5|nr:SPX domain family protein [Clavispora lusitaniae]
MKFSHSIKFNAVPEWQDYYLNYPALKKVIYNAQQNQLENSEPNDGSIKVNHANISDLIRIARRNKALQERREAMQMASSSAVDEEDISNEKFNPSKLVNKLRFKKNKDITEEKEIEKGVSAGDDVEVHSFELDGSTYRGSIDLDVFTEANEAFSAQGGADPLPIFSKCLSDELTKIDKFFKAKEAELYHQYDNLMKDLEANRFHDKLQFSSAYHGGSADEKDYVRSTLERTTTNASVFDTVNHLDIDMEKGSIEEDEEEDDDEEEDEDHHSSNSALLTKEDFDVKKQKQITLKRRSIHMFISLSELKSFIELNRIGFTKICKKFDKTCNYSVKEDFINNFLPNNSRTFFPQTSEKLDYSIEHLVHIYATLSGRSYTDKEALDAIRLEMKSYLRDHIVWERNTVWKDLLSLEKNNYNLNLDETAVGKSKLGDEAQLTSLLQLSMKDIKIPFTEKHISLPKFLFTSQIIKLTIIIIVFIILLAVKTMNDKQEARCLAVLVASAMLWATEALPLWVTSMLVPLLVVTCQVLKDSKTGGPMGAADASTFILGKMWSSTLMILLAGFTLAGALSKYNVAKIVSSYMLAFAGTKPRNVLFAIMSVALFLSMWISNVAAPVLAYSLIQPVLRTLPTEAPFSQALVLGIALASNLGGMASPIASPQNVIAIQYMNPNPGWGKWFAVAIPVSVCSMIFIWMELILTFKISTSKVKAYKPIKEKLTAKQWYVSIVCIGTIILWCVESKIESTFGSSGIIAVVPVILLFGTGILKVADVNNFPWTIILLAMGGLALGSAVTSSGLLATIASALQKKVENFEAFVILLIFGLLILVVATFVSHTVATIIIVPLVKEVGESMAHPHPLLLIMGTALLASGAMGLPTSGFPNVTAISMTDEVGKRYLTVNTFITRGVPASIITYIFVITLGYGIMSCLSF